MLAYFINAPVWVWPLFSLLSYLGWQQSQPYRVGMHVLFIMPLIILLLSMQTVTSLASQTAVVCWLLGGLAGCMLVWRLLPPVSTGLTAGGQLQVEGSWLPMMAMLSVFGLKYAMGIAAAKHSVFWLQAVPLAASSGLLGMVSGMFALRAILLWQQARHWRLATA